MAVLNWFELVGANDLRARVRGVVYAYVAGSSFLYVGKAGETSVADCIERHRREFTTLAARCGINPDSVKLFVGRPIDNAITSTTLANVESVLIEGLRPLWNIRRESRTSATWVVCRGAWPIQQRVFGDSTARFTVSLPPPPPMPF